MSAQHVGWLAGWVAIIATSAAIGYGLAWALTR